MDTSSGATPPLPDTQGLRRQAVKGVGLVGFGTAVSRVLSFLQTIVLARLLIPSDFGLVTMMDVVVSLAGIPGGTAIGAVLIQRRVLDQEAFATFYWLNLLFGLAAYALVVVASPWVAALYSEPRILLLIHWAALSLMFSAVGLPFQSLIERSLQFQTLVAIELCAAFVGMVVAVTAAANGAGVMALIAANLTTSALKSILLLYKGWRLSPLRLRLRFADARDNLSFSVHLMAQRGTNYLSSNVDFLLIGRFVGAHSLGYYVLAYNLVNIPSNYVNAIFSRVSYPVLARLQDDPPRLRRVFMRVQELTSAVNFPILFGMACVADTAIPVVYGPSWTESIVLLKILVVLGLGRSIAGTIGPLILATGRSDLGFRWSVLVFALQVPGLYAGLRAGSTVGVAIAFSALVVLYTIIHYPILLRALLGPCLREYVGTMSTPLTASIAMVIAVEVLSRFCRALPPAIALTCVVTVGAAVYVGAFLAVSPSWAAEVRSLVKEGRLLSSL